MPDHPSDHADQIESPKDVDGVRSSVPDPALSEEAERARAVAEVLADQAAKEHARRALGRPPGTTWPRVGAMAVLAVVALYAWFASPTWLDPRPPPPVSVEREHASLRLAMYIQAQRIEAFRDDRGRLPDVLEEAGEPLPGIRYDRLDARTYRLRGSGERARYLYVSTDSLQVWTGDAARILGISQ